MAFIGGYNKNAHELPAHDYQEAAHDFLVNRMYVEAKMGAGLFLDPGLGKTRITLAMLDTLFSLGAIERALVIAPLRPVYTVWPNELDEWGFPQSMQILHDQYQLGIAMDKQIELMNYDSLKHLMGIENRWDIIVLDESTYVKNWSTKRMGYVKHLIKTIPKRVILTGTPAANSLHDLFSQLYVIDDGQSLGRTVGRFRGNFCYQGGWMGRKFFVNESAGHALEHAICDRVLRMQAEDYLDMPKIVFNELWVDLPDETLRIYKRFEREMVAELETGTIHAANASGAYTKCRQIASGQVFATTEDGKRIKNPGSDAEYEYHVAHREKIKALCELIEELAGKPIMVFYWYKHEAAELLNCKALWKSPHDLPEAKRKLYYALKKSGDKAAAEDMLKPPMIAGKQKGKRIPLEKVNQIIKEWNDGEHQVILCQWAATSHGLNMQYGPCQDIATITLTESAEQFEQGYRRMYRQGYRWPQVRIHRIVCKNTSDEVQLLRVDGKLEGQAAFLDALKKHAKGIL